jgi:signal transduction histidine kinase
VTLSTRGSDTGVRIEIRDNGPGMPPEVKSRVFDPFFTTKDVGKGTGLGLSISHGIVERHGGSMTVESEPGRGTLFVIELPLEAPVQESQ